MHPHAPAAASAHQQRPRQQPGGAAWRAGAKVALLPPIPYGTTTNQSGTRLTLNLMPTTILAILRDLLGSLARHGIRKVVILNSHGGNDFKWMLRDNLAKGFGRSFVVGRVQ